MKKIALMSLVTSSLLMAGGYKVPETSTNAVALGAANVAHNQNSADAAYYNPAKMIFMSDENHMEADLTYIGLNKVTYKGTVNGVATDESSESENFFIPTLHYVSPKLGDNDTRVGLSIVTPGGLSKRWTKPDGEGIKKAEEFTLKTVEINPTVAFKISDKIGFGVGFRILKSHGVANGIPVPNTVYQFMSGDGLDFGYNLALEYKPVKALEIGVTYRSKINMHIDGNADLKYPNLLDGTYDGSVSLPLPGALNVAVAYTFPTKTTVEFVYERTYWSAYKSLNFEYTDPTAEAVFGQPKNKDWSDTNTFRLGLTQQLDKLTVMAGLVIDESPIPNQTIGFELPGTDTTSLSLGGRYNINKKIDIGLSALYSMHDNRTINASDNNDNGLVGEFSDGDVLIISAGIGYKF